MKQKKILLSERLLNDGWFNSEDEAKTWIMLRRVLVDNLPAVSLTQKVLPFSEIRVKEYYKKRYVNKGGLKLEGALCDFVVDASGKTALDCGASAGGFTDCLLQHGASRVYSVDAGHGQLAGKLAGDARVVNMEKTNISDSVLLTLDPVPELITLDLSYLSLRVAVPVCRDILHGRGTIVCLIKPVFEIEDSEARREGNITDRDTLCGILTSLAVFFNAESFAVTGVTHSPVTGNGGALEYFACLELGEGHTAADLPAQIEQAVARSFALDKFKK
jgi:23S rRNA (cytidine1920-2'-O)/16S rRNA (cytidine1409-2'-O)-methyltransferase